LQIDREEREERRDHEPEDEEQTVNGHLGPNDRAFAWSLVHVASPRRWRTPLLARAASATIPRMSGMVATWHGRATALMEVAWCAV
jgi:hypothetical protein